MRSSGSFSAARSYTSGDSASESAVSITRSGSMKVGWMSVRIDPMSVVEWKTRASAAYCGPCSCLTALTATIPSTTRIAASGNERRMAAFRASAALGLMRACADVVAPDTG